MYEYKKQEGDNHPFFLFKTEGGSEYTVTFIDFVKIGDIEIQSVTIYCDSPRFKDLKIGSTINAIIREHLEDRKNTVLSYVCDSEDNREFSRQRKFIGWYELYAKESKYTLIPFDIPIQGTNTTYYSALIFDNETYSREFIDTFYKEELKEYVDK